MKKCVVLVVSALAMVLILAGCVGGGEDDQSSNPVNIAFVVGIADGETRLDSSIDELKALPDKPGTDYAFISAEGDPAVIGEAGTIPDFSDRGYTDVMMERTFAGIKADLIALLEAYEPVSPEIDMAAAIELSVNMLHAHAVNGRQNLLVFYSGGKSTTGLINMVTTPVYKMDVEESVSAIAQQMNLDMSGIDIIWYCCGYFGPDQPELSFGEKETLKEFYEQLFTTLGAESVTFRDDPPLNECYHFADTPVSCMAVEGTASALVELAVLDPEIFEDAKTALETPIVIPEEQVRFQSDSTEFYDPAAAAKAIQPVADFLLAHPELNLLLYGTCAGETDSEYTLWLGRARAERVKSVLLEAGIDEDRVTAVTVKAEDDPYYQMGLGTGEEASVNRKTVMVDMSTAFAQQILSKAIYGRDDK